MAGNALEPSVSRELRKFSPINLDFISILPVSGCSRRNLQMCLVVEEKDNTKGLWSRTQSMTQVSNGLATGAWKSSSSQLTALPSHPARKLGLEILDTALLFIWIPVRFQVTDPWRTLGLHAQLPFASSAPLPPTSSLPSWLAAPGSHDIDGKCQMCIFQAFFA